jgi:hypothetical protein
MLNLDGRILTKALVYAIVAIDALPEERRPTQDRNEMVHLLHLMITDPAQREQLAVEVEAITGQLADLTDWSMLPPDSSPPERP